MSIPCEWSYTDSTACEHNPDDACAACVDSDAYDVTVLVLAARDVGDHIGAPWGSSWEVPPETEQGAYCLASIGAWIADPGAELTSMGFDPTEGA